MLFFTERAFRRTHVAKSLRFLWESTVMTGHRGWVGCACVAAMLTGGVSAQVRLAWSARLDGGDRNDDFGYQQVVMDDGSVAVTGYSWSDATGYDVLTAKYDADGQLLWQQRFDGGLAAGDGAYDIAADAAGNLFAFGYSSGRPGGNDLTLLKYDPDGSLLWAQHYDGPANSTENPGNPNAVAADDGGNVYVTGQSVGLSGYSEFVTLKYDADGQLQWERRYAGAGGDNASAWGLVLGPQGQVYVAGDAPNGNGNHDLALLRYDADGNLAWVRQYDGPDADWEFLYNIAGDDEGNVYLCGVSYSPDTNYDYVTVKYDGDGQLQWASRYDGGRGVDYCLAVAVDAQQNVYVTGQSLTGGGQYDIATIRYLPDGTEHWVRRYSDPGWFGEDGGYAVAVDSNGSAYVGGYTWRGWSRSGDAVLLRYEPDGTLLWEQIYDGPPGGEDAFFSVTLDADDNVYVSGVSLGANTRADYLTIKYLQVSCTGQEQITKAKCRNRNGADQLMVNLAGGVPGDSFAVGLSSGQRKEGTVKNSGKAAAKFKNLDAGPGTATATWGCGGVAVREFECP